MSAGRTLQIVLAAGRSERMGSPKPLLDFGGRTALELVLEAAAGAGVPSSLVVVGHDGDAVIAAHAARRLPPRIEWVRNDEPGSEQLRSLQLGLAAARDKPFDAFFVHPVDHPLAASADYSLLLRAFQADTGQHEVFIPSHESRRGHPMLCRASLAARFASLAPDRTARDVVESSRIAYVPTPNVRVREDMDTPADYERLRAAYLAHKANQQPSGRRDEP